MRSLHGRWLTLALLIGVLAAPAAWGQQEEDEAVQTVDNNLSFVSGVTVVTVPVTVLGPNNEYVSGLEASDFKIFDNGVEQSIDSFEVSFLPISLVICVQSSARVEGILPDIQKTAILFTETVLGEFGEAAVIAFDNRVRLLQDFTADQEKIDAALKGITVGSDAVRLSDGVYEAIRLLVQRPSNHRRVIVVISESQETSSEISLGETLRTAQLHDIMIYPIRLSSLSARLTRKPVPRQDPIPPGVIPRPTAPGAAQTPTTVAQSSYDATSNVIPMIIDAVRGVKNLIFSNPLEALAKGTGGDDYSPRTEDGLQEAILRVGEDLRSQYLLSYRPNNLNEGGIFHHITVETPYEQLKVRARPGYFQGPSAAPAGASGNSSPEP